MGKKTKKLQRIVQKLANQYGADDEDVVRLTSELTVLESLEVYRPERRARKRKDFKFQTRAKQLFFSTSEQATH